MDRYIVGQAAAKRAVAIAPAESWRRWLSEKLRDEVMPKNIVLVGPTGVGKTEIARRLARLAGAPFVKVEASKFTEVGYVGKDVDSMIRDLVEAGVALVREERQRKSSRARTSSRKDGCWNLLLPGSRDSTREKLRGMLRAGGLDDRTVEWTCRSGPRRPCRSSAPRHGGDGPQSPGDARQPPFGKKSKKRSCRCRRRGGCSRRTRRRSSSTRTASSARRWTGRSRTGSCSSTRSTRWRFPPGRPTGRTCRGRRAAGPASIVEGSTVNTKYGPVKTDHVLFIAAGAFHLAKVSDLLPELQGRFPIRVELEALSQADLVRILAEPRNALTRQYSALLGAEGVELVFDASGIEELARVAQDMNTRTQNIGARRLHTVLEKVLEDVSFAARACRQDRPRGRSICAREARARPQGRGSLAVYPLTAGAVSGSSVAPEPPPVAGAVSGSSVAPEPPPVAGASSLALRASPRPGRVRRSGSRSAPAIRRECGPYRGA